MGSPAAAAETTRQRWRARLLTPGVVVLMAALAVALVSAGWAVAAATEARGRLPRVIYLLPFTVPLSLTLPLGFALWRRLFPGGRLSRWPGWTVWLVGLISISGSCLGPLPWLFFKVIDPIGNRNELTVIREGLDPLVSEMRAELRRQGHPPADLAPLLDRHLAVPPGWLRPVGAGNGGQRVLYYPGAGRFALAVWGTPPHRDDRTLVVYTSWDDRWAWKDKWDVTGARISERDRRWVGPDTRDLGELDCDTGVPEERWVCRSVEEGPGDR